MKKIFFNVAFLLGISCFTSCNYLDIVPDEREKEEDAFTDPIAAERMLYSCYGYIQNPGDNTSSIDYFTGDEVLTPFNNIDGFAEGSWTANTSKTSDYYRDLYAGIRQCYLFLEHMDDFSGIDEKKEGYKAQCHFLIGYYHMRLLMGWGPIIIVDKAEDLTTFGNYRSRNTLKECVEFICGEFDKAINSGAMETRYEGNQVGLATSVVALSLKAYTLMYYASPLFNGNENLSQKLRNPDGTELITATYEPERWEQARIAYKAAIEAAHAAGHTLFSPSDVTFNNKYPEDPTLRALRGNMVTPVETNPEEIWTYYFDEGGAGLQLRSMPYIQGKCYNGVAPTLNVIDRFYTENGLPWEYDTNVNGKDKFTVTKISSQNNSVKINGQNVVIAQAVGNNKNRSTPYMNLHREPRFYAWIAFQGGWYELDHGTGYDANSKFDGTKVLDMPGNLSAGKRLVTEFVSEGNCGKQGRANNYSRTGYLNKKGVSPDSKADKTNTAVKKYPFPMLRLANLYLSYAECAAECGMLGDSGDNASGGEPSGDGARAYLNAVRVRAGIPDVDASWATIGVSITDKQQMVDIVRRERQIEFYLENQNFWDVRRWLIGETLQGPYRGLNVENGSGYDGLCKEAFVDLNVRNFTEKNYFFPFPSWDINNNADKCAQNPGY